MEGYAHGKVETQNLKLETRRSGRHRSRVVQLLQLAERLSLVRAVCREHLEEDEVERVDVAADLACRRAAPVPYTAAFRTEGRRTNRQLGIGIGGAGTLDRAGILLEE